ncbi:MAG: phosphate ABC transporter permease subunit PstC [Candidatus Schekmanbacteria bacterium]|nr:phosphate ABC transporter permease subunit PstC [Candidatus Schekmanbacteria bacterium]
MNTRQIKDTIAHKSMFLICLLVLNLALLIAWGLYRRAQPILATKSLGELLLNSTWHPGSGQFGLDGFILGTIWVTGIAIVIAVPLSILTAVYLAEYAPRKLSHLIKPVIDLLAGISPVIHGVWGVITIVPLVRDYMMPFFTEKLPFLPFSSDNYTGFCALTGGIVLAVMIFPIIISVVCEVLHTVPAEIREASLSLGATKWQTTKLAVLRKVYPGLVAAVILGLSRALGETIAVLMVAGCSLFALPKSFFDPAYPLPALIANTYGEMMSIPLYDSAVLLAAFILLLLTTLFNVAGWGILLRLERSRC